MGTRLIKVKIVFFFDIMGKNRGARYQNENEQEYCFVEYSDFNFSKLGSDSNI